MNTSIEFNLGKDAVNAWNHRFDNIGYTDHYTTGDTIKTQFWTFCQCMIPAFEQMRGSYQGVASPFEFRVPIENLEFKK